MKLSIAIRLGAMLRPQGFDGLNTPYVTCGFAAALEAIGAEKSYSALLIEWPFLKVLRPLVCPACQATHLESLLSMGMHLNDVDRWSRERIADFVEIHEPAESALSTEDALIGEMWSEPREAEIAEVTL